MLALRVDDLKRTAGLLKHVKNTAVQERNNILLPALSFLQLELVLSEPSILLWHLSLFLLFSSCFICMKICIVLGCVQLRVCVLSSVVPQVHSFPTSPFLCDVYLHYCWLSLWSCTVSLCDTYRSDCVISLSYFLYVIWYLSTFLPLYSPLCWSMILCLSPFLWCAISLLCRCGISLCHSVFTFL